MDTTVFLNINKIIERESKTTTYKFALLRGTIEIVGANSPFLKLEDGVATIPLGLLIEKWLLYYYPLLEAEPAVPQINGGLQLAFEPLLRELIAYYKTRGGLSAYYNDLHTKGIGGDIGVPFEALVRKLRETITKMPMRYLGSSISNTPYSIFKYRPPAGKSLPARQNAEWLIHSFGTFTIPIDYYEAFRLFGSFLTGTDSILFKWAEFSVAASGNLIPTASALTEVLKVPITEREVGDAKKLYKSVLARAGQVHCVWTDAAVTSYDVDHMIPFAVWRNNDLWNLLPAKPAVNNRKRHKIPTAAFLQDRQEAIFRYWQLLKDFSGERFMSEIRMALLGNATSENWEQHAFAQLLKTSNYLIHTRGYEAWQP